MSGIDPATVATIGAALREDDSLDVPAALRRADSLGAWIVRLAAPPRRALVWTSRTGWRPSIVLDDIPDDPRLVSGTVTVLGPRGPRTADAAEIVLEAALEPAERRLLSSAQREAEREALLARRMLHACDAVVRQERSTSRHGADVASLSAHLRGHPAVQAAAEQLGRTWKAYADAHRAAVTPIELAPPLARLSDVEAMAEFLRHPRGPRHTPPRRPRPDIESTLH